MARLNGQSRVRRCAYVRVLPEAALFVPFSMLSEDDLLVALAPFQPEVFLSEADFFVPLPIDLSQPELFALELVANRFGIGDPGAGDWECILDAF